MIFFIIVKIQKSELDSRNKYNLDVVPDEVLYNWPILGHSWSFERSAVGFWRQVKDTYAHFKKIKPDALFGVLMFGTKRMVIPLSKFSQLLMINLLNPATSTRSYSVNADRNICLSASL